MGYHIKVTSSPTITMAPLEDYVPKRGHRMKQQPKSTLAMNGKSWTTFLQIATLVLFDVKFIFWCFYLLCGFSLGNNSYSCWNCYLACISSP
jgi:hypothetical protein